MFPIPIPSTSTLPYSPHPHTHSIMLLCYIPHMEIIPGYQFSAIAYRLDIIEIGKILYKCAPVKEIPETGEIHLLIPKRRGHHHHPLFLLLLHPPQYSILLSSPISPYPSISHIFIPAPSHSIIHCVRGELSA